MQVLLPFTVKNMLQQADLTAVTAARAETLYLLLMITLQPLPISDISASTLPKTERTDVAHVSTVKKHRTLKSRCPEVQSSVRRIQKPLWRI